MPLEQAAAIPFRRHNDDWQFCLITSMKRKRWIFPKGIIDPGETPEETALKEADEEAGLRGQIVGPPLGAYPDVKWGKQLVVSVMLMEVEEAANRWLEKAHRTRRWASADEVRSMVEHDELLLLFERAVEQLEQQPR